MKRRRFSIPSLALAGIAAHDPAQADTTLPDPAAGAGSEPAWSDVFRQDHIYILAGHRSHSSHRSHGSHRSGSGGGYSPAPVYTPPVTRNRNSTPPSAVLPSSPATAAKTLPGHTDKFKDIVRRVQMGLMAYGYYHGTIDGVVGPETKAALIRMQTDFRLNVTGTVTPEVLDALRIVAD